MIIIIVNRDHWLIKKKLYGKEFSCIISKSITNWFTGNILFCFLHGVWKWTDINVARPWGIIKYLPSVSFCAYDLWLYWLAVHTTALPVCGNTLFHVSQVALQTTPHILHRVRSSPRLPFTSAVITATVLAHAVGYQATNSVAKQQVCHMNDAWRRIIKIDVVKLKVWLVICSIVLSTLCDLWQDEMCTVCVFTKLK